MGFPARHGGTPMTLIGFMESPKWMMTVLKWMMTRGTPMTQETSIWDYENIMVIFHKCDTSNSLMMVNDGL